MAEGRRRLDLEAAARAMFLEVFGGRVLPFRHGCRHRLRRYLRRTQAGRAPTATVDLMIASVVRSQNASVVTRDISGFEGCGPHAHQSVGCDMTNHAYHIPFRRYLYSRRALPSGARRTARTSSSTRRRAGLPRRHGPSLCARASRGGTSQFSHRRLSEAACRAFSSRRKSKFSHFLAKRAEP